MSIDSNFTAIQADVQVPASWAVPDASDYINFYLGFDDLEEAGISFSHSNNNWHYFCNPNGLSYPFTPPLLPGQTVHLKLINNGGGTMSLYVNGYLRFANIPAPGLGKTSSVKMACAASDCPPNTDNVTHAQQLNWSNVQVERNGAWVTWDSAIGHQTSTSAGTRYTVQQELPLSAKLTT